MDSDFNFNAICSLYSFVFYAGEYAGTRFLLLQAYMHRNKDKVLHMQTVVQMNM